MITIKKLYEAFDESLPQELRLALQAIKNDAYDDAGSYNVFRNFTWDNIHFEEAPIPNRAVKADPESDLHPVYVLNVDVPIIKGGYYRTDYQRDEDRNIQYKNVYRIYIPGFNDVAYNYEVRYDGREHRNRVHEITCSKSSYKNWKDKIVVFGYISKSEEYKPNLIQADRRSAKRDIPDEWIRNPENYDDYDLDASGYYVDTDKYTNKLGTIKYDRDTSVYADKLLDDRERLANAKEQIRANWDLYDDTDIRDLKSKYNGTVNTYKKAVSYINQLINISDDDKSDRHNRGFSDGIPQSWTYRRDLGYVKDYLEQLEQKLDELESMI